MNASEVYLDEKLLQKLIDSGLDHRVLRSNPLRISLQEAKEWLEAKHHLVIDSCYHTDSEAHYSAEVRRVRFFEHVGATFKTGKRYDTPEQAEIAAIEFIVDDFLSQHGE